MASMGEKLILFISPLIVNVVFELVSFRSFDRVYIKDS